MAVTITKEEEQLSYASYFHQPLAPIPQDKLDVLKGGPAAPSMALSIEDRNQFLEEEVPGLQVGYCVAPNGTGFVANTTFMPNVTPEMFYWWFGWHSITSDLRYKIWDPEDHYYARADKPEYVLDPKIPVSEKTWGVTHDILEDIGMGPDPLKIAFKKPSEFGYDMKKLGTKGCAALVCGVGTSSAPAFMSHKCREVEGGIMFESRFWMGYGYQNGQLIKLVPEGVSIPKEAPMALFGHNIKEFTNLAAILPSLYEKEKDNW
ncbi:hypothetical protein lbkm_0103 [Lachnospiraceae bacterium KM106-2]|nr:hypothetical protein lbkm_0103 [Lachnospiraceae bacterium KM106-2]